MISNDSHVYIEAATYGLLDLLSHEDIDVLQKALFALGDSKPEGVQSVLEAVESYQLHYEEE